MKSELFEVPAFREANLPVLVVVFDAFLLPGHGRARVSVATFPVTRRVVAVVGVVPARERLRKFLKNPLT